MILNQMTHPNLLIAIAILAIPALRALGAAKRRWAQ